VDSQAIRAVLDRMRAPGPPRIELLQAGGERPATVGLVPGTFDPMTVAHAALAEALGTELTLFVYSVATLPKEAGPGGEATPPLLAPEARVASLLAYCASSPDLGVALCSHGLYADQAVAFTTAFPGSRLTFGLGSDKLVQLVDPSWYEDRDAALDVLFARAEVVYALREEDDDRIGAAMEAAGRWRHRLRSLEMPSTVTGVSSRQVRELLRRGGDPSAYVPPEILPFLGRR
jgi:nicotinamide-nucleotide adenylyltransferase